MPYEVFDLNPVDRITADAVGAPGERVFYIQARKGSQLVTVLCEKEHVVALTLATDQVLLSLAEGDVDAVIEPDPVGAAAMGLEYPVNPAFRAGQVNLGYDQVSQRLVVLAYELLPEEDTREPSVARFWATPAQMRAFSVHGQEVVAAGRPVCAMCGEPIDPEGHFCPRRNGHRT
ncbi:MAG TPA: DUF3090 family protein [Anaerolineae bacterium]|nr:DUF3090 family protein [Anaerolineae bacterium]